MGAIFLSHKMSLLSGSSNSTVKYWPNEACIQSSN
jgi:hypothetical protein